MEVSSSPAGHTFDNDIDIDFGDYGGGVHLTDDERMLEDGDHTRPATATDEIMDDDEPTLTEPVNEEVMHDDNRPELADEELIDYDDESYNEQGHFTFDDTTLRDTETSFLAPTGNLLDAETVDEEIPRKPEDAVVEQPTVTIAEEYSEAASRVLDQKTKEPLAAAVVEPAEEHGVSQNLARGDDTQDQNVTSSRQEDSADHATEDEPERAQQSTQDATESLKAPPQRPGALETDLAHVADGPPTPSETGLHPVLVRFGGLTVPLFKSRQQPDGLVKDDNLASVSLGDLLLNCRQRLVNRGETIVDDQELVLNFDRLGLMVVEDTRPAASTSLNEILDVYLLLHHHDGTEEVPPLSLTLSTQLRFTSSFNMFKQAAEQGQGMSRFAFLQPADEGEAYYPDEDDLPPEDSDQLEEQTYDHGDEERHEGDEVQLEESTNFQADQDQAEYDRDDTEVVEAADETEHDNVGPETQGLPSEGHDRHEAYDESGEYVDENDEDNRDGQDEDESYDAAQGYAAEADEFSAPIAENTEEAAGPDVAASTAIVRERATNNTAGEYDLAEDFIDWDDDDLTQDNSEAPADDGTAENSTLLNDPQETADDTSVLVDETRGTDSNGSHTTPPQEDAFALEPRDDQPEQESEAEAFFDINELTELPEDDEEEAYPNEAGEELAQYDEPNYAQADTLDDEADELPRDDDDEQFHTAVDLLDDQHAEHDYANGEAADAGTNADGEQHDDEDDIGFDDDADYTDHEANASALVDTPTSLKGKRSFEEHAEEDDGGNEPELKKARSS